MSIDELIQTELQSAISTVPAGSPRGLGVIEDRGRRRRLVSSVGAVVVGVAMFVTVAGVTLTVARIGGTSEVGEPTVPAIAATPSDSAATLGVGHVWPEIPRATAPADLGTEFAHEVLGWVEVDVASETGPDASGPVWVTIQRADEPIFIDVLTAPLGEGRVIFQVGPAGMSITRDETGPPGEWRIGIPQVATAVTVEAFVRMEGRDDLVHLQGDATDLAWITVEASDASVVQTVLVLYRDGDNGVIDAVGGHFTGPETSDSVTTTEAPAGATTTSPPETTTVVPTAVDAVFPDDWPDFLGRTADLIAYEGGVGFALVPIETDEGGWALAFSIDGEYRGATALALVESGVGVGFTGSGAAGEVIITGTAPLETASIHIDYGGDDVAVLDRPISRPDVGLTFFIGVAPMDAIEVIGGDGPPVIEATAFDAAGNIVVGYSGTALLGSPTQQLGGDAGLIVDSITVDLVPGVIACQAPAGATPPPNQGGVVVGAGIYPAAIDALQAFLAPGVGDPPIARSGYLEMVEPGGAITYGIGSGNRFVTLISVAAVEGGWTVDRWDASGC